MLVENSEKIQTQPDTKDYKNCIFLLFFFLSYNCLIFVALIY